MFISFHLISSYPLIYIDSYKPTVRYPTQELEISHSVLILQQTDHLFFKIQTQLLSPYPHTQLTP